jgi:tetratricopeptide (TPR) repeat protein
MERARRKPTGSLDAYDHYLCGVSELHKFTREANADALSNLYRAIELNPDFGSAYGQAGRCYAQRRGGGWVTDRNSDVAEATRVARRAVELGINDAVALCTAGFALADVADEVEDGDAYVERALALNPNLALAWLFSGSVKTSLGDPDAAIPRLLHAMRLSPQDYHMSTMQAAMATAHLVAGRYQEACSWAHMAARNRPPKQLFASALAAASSALAGRHDESQKMMLYVREAAPCLRLSNLKDVISSHRPREFDRWSEGLRKAGLPE